MSRIKITSADLIGMNLPIGIEVTDRRIMRRIGYWTGKDLADSPPSPIAENASVGRVSETGRRIRATPSSSMPFRDIIGFCHKRAKGWHERRK